MQGECERCRNLLGASRPAETVVKSHHLDLWLCVSCASRRRDILAQIHEAIERRTA
jgi:hypothetical protein